MFQKTGKSSQKSRGNNIYLPDKREKENNQNNMGVRSLFFAAGHRNRKEATKKEKYRKDTTGVWSLFSDTDVQIRL